MSVDIVVSGGGPAGGVAAITLAKYGYRIALINRPRRFIAIEGLSERALAGLRFAGCTRALQRIGQSVRREASWNGEQFAGNREWVVERDMFDAAFAIDPLSGHGVYEALGGALVLAATINTLLARPQDAAAARRFYRERIENDFWRMSRIGRDFYRQEQRWPERAFWRERRAWPDEEPAHASPGASPTRIERRPVNVDGFISLQEVIVTGDHPRGLWQVAGVSLVPLLRCLREQGNQPPANVLDAFARQQGVALRDCKTALAWLISRRLLDCQN